MVDNIDDDCDQLEVDVKKKMDNNQQNSDVVSTEPSNEERDVR